LRIDEKGVSKSVLVKLSQEQVKFLSDLAQITQSTFTKNYVVARQRKSYVCILNARYAQTIHSLPSEGGRLRELSFDTNWLTVAEEHILPKPSVTKYAPIPYKMIYA
jgi:Rad3-related DNA helicase